MTFEAYLTEDHRKLENLLANSMEDADAYTEFRRLLLRHIGIEEKILFNILREGGEHKEIVAKLRLHHGALAALIIPKLTYEIKSAIEDIFVVHNAIEEGVEGIYAIAEHRVEVSGGALTTDIDAIPAVPLSSAIDKLEDLGPVKRAMERAGFDPNKYFTV